MKKGFYVLAAAVLLLASCEMGPVQATPDLSYANVAPVPLAVSKIVVRDDYNPPMQPPNVEHLFRQTPASTVHDLLDHALTPAGGPRMMRVVIEDASVIDTRLPTRGGMMATINPEPSDRYDAKISLRFEVFDPASPDIVVGHANVVARRSTTLMSNFSPADREKAAFGLNEGLMRDVLDSLHTTVNNTFGHP